ncbi:hypothetical protein [Dyadobacter beijingensis]|nr:hypothetical protein [Dyadobacter beijingensis]
MNWILASVGILLVLLGMAIWHFKLVGWLSNVPERGEIKAAESINIRR